MTIEADLLIVGAPVYTADPARPLADAVAVRAGRIAAVGPERDLAGLRGPATRLLRLAGGLVLPGFQDAHVHTAAGGLELAQCDLHEVEPDGYPAAVARYAADHPDAGWVLGGGWVMDAFGVAGPHLATLDAVVADRPVYLESTDGHSAWVNRRALELAGVTRATPTRRGAGSSATPPASPPAPSTRRRWAWSATSPPSRTRPTGRPRSSAARPTCTPSASPPGRTPRSARPCWTPTGPWPSGAGSAAGSGRSPLGRRGRRGPAPRPGRPLPRRERGAAAGRGGQELRRRGVREPHRGHARPLPGRRRPPHRQPRHRHAGRRRAGPGGHRAGRRRLRRPRPRHRRPGRPRDPRRLRGRGRRQRPPRRPPPDRPPPVRPPDDRPRFRRLGVVANAQPYWSCLDGYMRELTLPFLDPERAGWQYPWASLRRAGAVLAFGSDWTVSTADPLQEIEVATCRVAPDDRDREPFLPGERVDLPTALDAFTSGSAYALRLEADTGSVTPGKLADLAILDRDLFDPAAGPMGDARVLATLVEGEPVHADPSLDLG